MAHRARHHRCLALCALVFWACGAGGAAPAAVDEDDARATSLGDGGEADGYVAEAVDDEPPAEAADDERKNDEVGKVVFDPSRVAEMHFEVSEEELAILRADADKPMGFEDFTYVAARLTYDGTTYEDVGLRVKGNNSRVTAKGDAVPFKLDMNEFVAGQKLDGLTKVNLHNNGNQPHGMSDFLSYTAFREAGVAASRTGWADLYLNGEKLGLYTLVEQVDDKMLARWYDRPESDLYKPEPQAGFLGYLGDAIDDYQNIGYESDNDTDHSTFLKFVETVNRAPVSSWDVVIDVESVLMYLAGNVALGNWDTYVSMGHNYYLFEATPGRLVMLPWDMNLSQAGSTAVCAADLRMSGGPGGFPNGMPPEGFPGRGDARGAPPDGGPRGPGGGPMGARSAPLYDGLMADPTTFARYREVLSSFVAGPASVDALFAHIDLAAQAVGDRVASSTLDQLRGTIEARVRAIKAALPTTTECRATSATTTP